MIEIDNIYNMDCIEGMKLMADGSVDAVIADMPYGVLNRSNRAAHWDRQIPLEALFPMTFSSAESTPSTFIILRRLPSLSVCTTDRNWYAAQPDFHQKKCSNSRTLLH